MLLEQLMSLTAQSDRHTSVLARVVLPQAQAYHDKVPQGHMTAVLCFQNNRPKSSVTKGDAYFVKLPLNPFWDRICYILHVEYEQDYCSYE